MRESPLDVLLQDGVIDEPDEFLLHVEREVAPGALADVVVQRTHQRARVHQRAGVEFFVPEGADQSAALRT